MPTHHQIDAPSDGYNDMEERRKLPRALQSTRLMRDAGETYLPKWEKEATTEWERRRDSSVLIDFYWQAVDGIVDQAFSAPLILAEDAGLDIEHIWLNIDNSGTRGDLLAKEAARDSLGFGISHLVVDMLQREDDPQFGRRPRVLAMDRRPFWRHLKSDQVIEALPVTVGGKRRLGRLRFRDSRIEPDGEWGSRVVEQIKVLWRGNDGIPDSGNAAGMARWARWEVWELETVKSETRGTVAEWRKTAEGFILPPLGASREVRDRFIEIPVIPVYTRRSEFFQGWPVFENLAEMNASHWQKNSNKDNTIAVASVPAKLIAGVHPDDLTSMQWGPFRVQVAKDAAAHCDDIAHSTNSVTVAHDDLDRLERRMAATALEPSLSRATGEELATSRLIDEAKKLSRTQAWAASWCYAFNEAMNWTAAWLGQEPRDMTQPWLSYREEVFEGLKGAPAFNFLLQMAAMDRLPTEILIAEAQRYGHLSDRWSMDEVKSMLAMEPGANMQESEEEGGSELEAV